MLKRLFAILYFCCLIAGLLPAHAMAEGATNNPAVLITEVQVGVNNAAYEFVELYNSAAVAQDVTGWELQYLSASHSDTNPATPKLVVQLSGVIQARSYTLFGHIDYPLSGIDGTFGGAGDGGVFAKSGGFVRVVAGGAALSQVDCIRWGGSATPVAGCDRVSSQSSDDYSLQRQMTDDLYQKQAGVRNLSPINPMGGGHVPSPVPIPEEPEITDPPTPPNPTVAPQCTGIVLSEILANPAGSDTNAEFIELYNTTAQPQSLAGCALKTSSGSKQFALPVDQTLAPGEYRAFYSDITGLTITNSGGEVWLITSSTETIVQYPSASDNLAWAAFGEEWQGTTVLTPNQPNVLSMAGGQGGSEDAKDDNLAPCPEGKYRNPETNRCKTIEADVELKPCDAGQERNPATNRCRGVTVTQASLTPCAEGSERNSETNRCRKVSSASTTLKPCNEGEERNPETNRCRKVAGVSTTATTPARPGSQKSPLHYGAIGAVVLGIAGYGAYEYRGDIGNVWARLRSRKTPPSA